MLGEMHSAELSVIFVMAFMLWKFVALTTLVMRAHAVHMNLKV